MKHLWWPTGAVVITVLQATFWLAPVTLAYCLLYGCISRSYSASVCAAICGAYLMYASLLDWWTPVLWCLSTGLVVWSVRRYTLV